MNRAGKWNGTVTVRVSGGSPERFFNLCSFHGISLEEMRREEDGIRFRMEAKDFFAAGRLAKKAGIKLRIKEKRGLPFFLRRSRKRLAFFLGILICLGLLYYSSLFIWDIHMEGNTKYTDSTLLHFLEEKGYVHGMKKLGIVCEEIEKDIRGRYGDITWVSAQISGNRLIIRIKENQIIDAEGTPASDESGTGMDLTASKNGTVVSVITRTGTPKVHPGDSVEKGQVLISGTLEILDEGGNLLSTKGVRADGDIVAATEYLYEDVFSLASPKKYYTGKKTEHRYLWLFGHRVFWPGEKNTYACSDETDSYEMVHLWENFYLPLGWGVITVREYREAVEVISAKEAEKKAELRFKAYCDQLSDLGVTITDCSLETFLEADSCRAVGIVNGEEAIGILGGS